MRYVAMRRRVRKEEKEIAHGKRKGVRRGSMLCRVSASWRSSETREMLKSDFPGFNFIAFDVIGKLSN